MDNETPANSPSIAKLIVNDCELEAHLRHRLLGGQPKEPSNYAEKGSLYHALMLGQEELIEVCDYKNWMSSAAKDAKADIRAEGRIPVLRHKYEEAVVGSDILRAKLLPKGYDLRLGRKEVKIEWKEPTESGDVLCHGILDVLLEDKPAIWDLKTTDQGVHPEICAATLLRQGGVIQDTAYRRAWEFHHPELAGRIDMVFLFVQTKPPWTVTPGRCDGSMREIGASQWARSCEIFGRCLKAGTDAKHWPEYVSGTTTFSAPGWAVAREIEKEW